MFKRAFFLHKLIKNKINHGDAGLESFLNKIASCTECLLIEPHPWKTYRKAKKRLKKTYGNTKHNATFEDLDKIENRGPKVLSFIDEIIVKNGFHEKLYLGETKWGRNIFIYKKSNTKSIGIKRKCTI